MKKTFLLLIFLFSLSLLLTPVRPVQALSLVDGIAPCLATGDCTPCDVLQVLANFAKFIFTSLGGLMLLFITWQSTGMIINWGNAEALKNSMDKIKNTLLAVLIVLVAYTLVGAFINLYAGGTFKTFIEGQTTNGSWNIGPKCATTKRPEQIIENSANPGLTSYSADTDDGGCKSSWESGSGGSCNGNCGGLEPRTAEMRAAQCQDASPELVALLQCLTTNIFSSNASTNYPTLAGRMLRINSISHNTGLKHCRTSWDSSCEHSQNSCHFGGGSLTNGSYAADIDNLYANGSSVNGSDLETLVKNCNAGNYFLNEGDHFHISTSSCRKQ